MGTTFKKINFTAIIPNGIDDKGNQYSSKADMNLSFDTNRIILTTPNEKFIFSKNDITGLSIIESNSGMDRIKSLILFVIFTAILALAIFLKMIFLGGLALLVLFIGVPYLLTDGRSFLIEFSSKSKIVLSFHIKRDNDLRSDIRNSFDHWLDI